MNALAGLMNPAAVGSSVQQAANAGLETGRKIRLRKALAALATNPDDPEATKTVLELNPEEGARIRQEQQARQFNGAAADYYAAGNSGGLGPQLAPHQAPQRPGSSLNALAAGLPGAARQQQPNALVGNALAMPPAAPSAFDQAFAPMAAQQPAQVPAQPKQQPEQAEPDFSVLGAPENHRDDAFLRMLKIDAKAAFAIDSQMRDRAADRLKLQRDAYDMAVSRLGGVNDDASYQAALADIAQTIEPLGVEVTDHLPAQFPGPDGLKQLRLGALDAKDQLTLFMQEANIDADNARMDRNTDSLIEDREARRGEYMRHNRAAEGNTRRGQDLTDARSRRPRPSRGGGDTVTETTRTGSDGGVTRTVTRRSSGGGSTSAPTPTATGANGEKYELRGGKWVRVK